MEIHLLPLSATGWHCWTIYERQREASKEYALFIRPSYIQRQKTQTLLFVVLKHNQEKETRY